jgi:hypothetical protein
MIDVQVIGSDKKDINFTLKFPDGSSESQINFVMGPLNKRADVMRFSREDGSSTSVAGNFFPGSKKGVTEVALVLADLGFKVTTA